MFLLPDRLISCLVSFFLLVCVSNSVLNFSLVGEWMWVLISLPWCVNILVILFSFQKTGIIISDTLHNSEFLHIWERDYSTTMFFIFITSSDVHHVITEDRFSTKCFINCVYRSAPQFEKNFVCSSPIGLQRWDESCLYGNYSMKNSPVHLFAF